MTDNPDTQPEETDAEDANLLGHDPVLGPSDPEADEHGDNLTRVDEDELGE